MKLIISRIRYVLHLFKQALLGKEKKFTSGSINKAIVLLSVPMVLEMVMESLFVCSNLFFVSRLGAGAISIVGTTESVISFAYSISIGLSIAASSIISRRIGEKKFKEAGLTAMQIIYIGFAISLILSILCVVFYEEILLLVGMPVALVAKAEWFAKIMFASIVFIILRISINGIFRGAGNAAIAMRTLWISNTINIVLCPVLIFGWGIIPAYGILGVALATAIARVIGVLYQFWHLAKGKTIMIIGKEQLMLSLSLIKKVLKLAITGAIQYMIPASSWVLMIKIVSHFGPNALAGYIIAQRVASIATMPAWGIGNAAGILTGQNLGANQHERAEKSVWKAGFLNMCFLCLVALFWKFTAEPVVLLFTNDPEVLKNGVLYLHYITIAYVLLGYTMVISRALNAAGDVKVVTLLYILMFYITQIPLSYLFGVRLDWGPKGIFVAILISELVLAIACIIVFKKGKWKYIKI
ncbi:MATE family efflux transporter [Aquimarina muelleri]|uniref:Multidrug-efflux transporter n=1 Tax=Aquimarina muelleri TaxID=279356 RepID=A0A918JYF9_9FLAO|nr:MATE family efflux transporter [Aquimarina muelleri]MCX2763248.1 MATE family efflux transporter [Aquimarina muelleri]GGX27694.1 MATE family efflux transporter [Aquimarina muelleri]